MKTVTAVITDIDLNYTVTGGLSNITIFYDLKGELRQTRLTTPDDYSQWIGKECLIDIVENPETYLLHYIFQGLKEV